MPLQSHKSLRLIRVLVAGTAMLLAIMLGVNVVLLGNLHKTTMQSAERDLARHSMTLAAQADRSFKSLDLVLSSVEDFIERVAPGADLWSVPELASRHTHEFLKEKLIGLPQVEELMIIGADGKIVSFSRRFPTPETDVSDRDYFKALKADAHQTTHFSAPIRDRGTGAWNVYMARRISSASGDFKGLVLGAVSLQHFEDFYRAISADSGSAISLVRQDGMLLVRFPRSDLVGTILEHAATLTNGRANVARLRSSINGEMRLVSSNYVSGYPLILTACQSEASILAPWWQMVRMSTLTLLLAAAGLIGATLALARWLIQRDALVHAASEQVNAERARAVAEAELLRERERAAAAASRAKSSFLAVMSHEIRTPMNAVLGLATTLLGSDLKPEDQEAVRAIHDAGDNLLDILNDILDYSKLEAGELTFESIAFAPVSTVEAPLAILAPRAMAKGLTLHTEIDPALPAALVGDAGRLRQVALNLLSNAVKFTEQGSVTAAVRCVAREGGRAIIEWEVRDTGIGIAPDKVGLLFRDYMQADCSINRRFGGSGLGLAICKRILDQMQGTITVSSEIGKGTTVRFRVCLEVTDAVMQTDALGHDEEAALQLEVSRLGRPLRVLVVDDNATNRMVVSRMLRELKAQVDAAGDGAEAITAAARFAYDLVLMDMRMPEMDGLEATRTIRSRRGPNARTPIIALTANAFADDVAACLAAGMDDFVAKPVRKKVLLGAMLRQLESDRATKRAPTVPVSPLETMPELLDAETYAALEDEIGPEAMREAVTECVAEARARLQALRDLAAGDDRVGLGREAHSLKGMSGQFGLERFAREAAKLEAAAATLSPDAAAAAVSRLDDLFTQSLERLPKPAQAAA